MNAAPNSIVGNSAVAGGGQRQPEEYVVDLTIEFAKSEVDSDAVVADLALPGAELARMAGPDCLAVTTVLSAPGELAAVESVHDVVLAQLGRAADLVAAAAVASISVGSLYALVDPDLPEDEYEHLDFTDLVERHVWNRPAWDYEDYLASERARLAASA